MRNAAWRASDTSNVPRQATASARGSRDGGSRERVAGEAAPAGVLEQSAAPRLEPRLVERSVTVAAAVVDPALKANGV